MTLSTTTLKHFKTRIIIYWLSDLYRFLGPYIECEKIYCNHADYKHYIGVPVEDVDYPINPIGDIDFLTGLTAYELFENEVDIIMPYIDCLRHMAINYFDNCTLLKRKEKMDKIYKIIHIMLKMRVKVPEKKWLFYNCDIAICDILKTFWNHLEYNYKLHSVVILFQDLPFINFDYKESVLGHLVLLWLMKDQFNFIQEIKKRE